MPDLMSLLERLTEPALGCTEPGAVALAAAAARMAVGGRAVRLAVIVDGNVYKNCMAVRIPGYHRTGVEAAAALGVAGGDPLLRLQVLKNIGPGHAGEADRLIDSGSVSVEVQKAGRLFIDVTVETASGTGRAVLDGAHTRFACIQANGCDVDLGLGETAASADLFDAGALTLEEIIDLVTCMGSAEENFVMQGVEMNWAVAESGLDQRLGMGVGAAIRDMAAEGWYSDDASTWVRTYTAAGADARMAGCPLPVTNSSGSGNQGLVITLSLAALARFKGYARLDTARAIALAHLVSAKIKAHTGKLSAVCGCAVAAATGAAAGMAMLLGGDQAVIESAVINMLGDITGEICDGAKEGCALKLATASAAALQAALLARFGVRIPGSNGIVGRDAGETICNVGRISNPGMIDTDRVILEVMKEKRAKHG